MISPHNGDLWWNYDNFTSQNGDFSRDSHQAVSVIAIVISYSLFIDRLTHLG